MNPIGVSSLHEIVLVLQLQEGNKTVLAVTVNAVVVKPAMNIVSTLRAMLD